MQMVADNTKILNELGRLKQAINKLAKKDEFINEAEAAALLGVSMKTLKNCVYDGRITSEMYTVGPTGKRFFNKQKLMGL